jgi:chromosome segregation ATPase
MTSTRYFIARIGQAFGYFRKAQRMGNAATEMHLLREAEVQLGAMIWENVEGIEPLSIEYWNLRKLVKERTIIRDNLAACREKLDLAHEERAHLLNNTPDSYQALVDERTALLTEVSQISIQRDQIVAAAREVRRAYVGLKMKLEVLTKEFSPSPANTEEIHKIKTRLLDLRHRFNELKQERIVVGTAIEEIDGKIDLVDAKFDDHKQDRRVHASNAFLEIGDGNREYALLRAESAAMDIRMRQLFAEIGRYVSRHAQQDPACASATAAYRGLVDVMRALRRSIALNHRLAGTA